MNNLWFYQKLGNCWTECRHQSNEYLINKSRWEPFLLFELLFSLKVSIPVEKLMLINWPTSSSCIYMPTYGTSTRHPGIMFACCQLYPFPLLWNICLSSLHSIIITPWTQPFHLTLSHFDPNCFPIFSFNLVCTQPWHFITTSLFPCAFLLS